MLDVDAIKARVDLVAVVGHYTPLKKRGHEYVGLCVAHNDHNPSMFVAPAKGLVHCFSCGFSADAIGFIQHVEGLSFKDALSMLNGGAPEWKPVITMEAKPVPERVTSRPPQNSGVPKMGIHALGEPVRTWAYRDTDGMILGYVARYETTDERGKKEKTIRTWTWGKRGDREADWQCGAFTKPRPLYGLDRLTAKPQAAVLIVEGEKAADAAAELLPSYAVLTWPGGAQAWKHADIAPLRGRKVLLWPDADAPGIKAMAELAAILSDPKGLACSVRLIDPTGQPEGFDAADFEGTTDELIAWAKPRAKDYIAPQQNPAPVAESPLPAVTDTAAPDAGLTEDAPEPPTGDVIPIEAYASDQAAKPAKSPQRRGKRHLEVVDGNAALQPDPEGLPEPISMSEDAIADAFAQDLEKDWRYVPAWGHWMHWDGDGWRRDQKELIDRLAVEMGRRAVLWGEAQGLTPDAKRRIGQKKTAGNVRDLARNDRRIAASPEGWDSDPLLVGVPGGVFDVRTGKVIEGEREQYITRCTSVAPAPGEPRRWLEHLRRMMDGDTGMIDFLQSFAGYCATGDVSEQCFLFLYGMGQTGKGTFLLTLAEIMGTYAAQSSASTFMSTDREKHSSEIARLASCRLVVIDETDGTARWNEERIKRMTGGGRITAARKYHDEEDIPVTWKLAFAGNHKPALRGVGKEMERRIRLVKCNASIPDDAVDRKFRERMIAEEGPQILAWILEGAVRWHDAGLPLPESVSDATRDYLESEDIIGEWIGERCEQRSEVLRTSAYRNYSEWAEKRGDRAWSNRAWWAAMEDRGYRTRKTGGAYWVTGLSLKDAVLEPRSYTQG